MSKLSKIYVPSEGNQNARILCVGESPGEDEESERRPFIGRAGELLTRYLGRAGVQRSEVFFTNLCKYRPDGDRFTNCLETPELSQGLVELKDEITTVKPNIILALGNWPMYFLTGLKADAKNSKPGSGITTWRGSIVPCSFDGGQKVAVTFHPAFVIRPNGFGNNPIFLSDVTKAVEGSVSPLFSYPQYESIIDPGPDTLDEILKELARSEYNTIDIETFGPELACFGVCNGVDRGICLTFKKKDRNWKVAQEILKNPAQKVFHYGQFDINYLYHYYGWKTNNYAWDTYIAANNLNPGFPKTLAFLTSFYTRFPYYKEDRKIWKASYDLERLWAYNIKDIIATHTIMLGQKKEIDEL